MQGCAMAGDKPGAMGHPAQALPSPMGCSSTRSERRAEPGGHSNESHRQLQIRQRLQEAPGRPSCGLSLVALGRPYWGLPVL